MSTNHSGPVDHLTTSTLATRGVFGGVLMGLANLVPGISGGTMLLAAGIYPRFIDAIAEVTRFHFRTRSLLVLGCVIGSAAVAVLLGAGTLKDLVVDHRWVMYSLFIGLTLGGVPVVWQLAKPASKSLVIGAVVAFIGMVGLALLQALGVVGGNGSSVVWLFIAGLAGASAMILPGISGGYLLLLLGQYLPILTAIDQVKMAMEARDFSAATEPVLTVVIPVGLGIVIGIIAVGNLLQWLLHHHRTSTLGVLLGLLLGSTVGLWPFQQSVPPQVGDVIKGQAVTAETLPLIDREDWATVYFRPTATQVAGAIGLILAGIATTAGVAHIGGNEP